MAGDFVAFLDYSASFTAVRMHAQSAEPFRFGLPDYFKGESAPGFQGAACARMPALT